MTVIKAAAVQLSPVLYSREGTVDKVIRQILALGRQGVQFATFPETVVPYYPYFSFVQPPLPDGRGAPDGCSSRPSPSRRTSRWPSATPASRRGWWRPSASTSATAARSTTRSSCSMPTARLIQHRRKISPTYHERMVWGQGDGSGLRARRQRGRSHRLAGVLGALQPAGPLRPDGRRRADPLGDVPRLVRGRPVRPADRGQHPPARPGVRLLRGQRHRLAGRRPAGPDHAGHRLPDRPDLGRLLHRDRRRRRAN